MISVSKKYWSEKKVNQRLIDNTYQLTILDISLQ